jgi:hypothetical protein
MLQMLWVKLLLCSRQKWVKLGVGRLHSSGQHKGWRSRDKTLPMSMGTGNRVGLSGSFQKGRLFWKDFNQNYVLVNFWWTFSGSNFMARQLKIFRLLYVDYGWQIETWTCDEAARGTVSAFQCDCTIIVCTCKHSLNYM